MLTELVSCTAYSLSCAVNSSHCVVYDGAPMCLCRPGFSGDTCDVNDDDCRDVTCQHGGTCVDATLSYHCHCAPGYTGKAIIIIIIIIIIEFLQCFDTVGWATRRASGL